ncbi:MAG: nitroreductase family protein, partial [Planctomycetota bacterium]|nr:nitroreductase family protein [Planctomycetota bacterium]
MPNLDFTVAPDKCVRCGACVGDCPRGIISRPGADALPEVPPALAGDCLECQHCLAICPPGAIGVFGLNPERSLELTPESLPSLRQMRTLLRGRRSVRQYRGENVPRPLLDELLATLANAPTGCNDRGLSFLVVDDRASLDALREKMVAALEERILRGEPLPEFLASAARAHRQKGEDELFRGAPHLLIVSAGAESACPKEDVDLALAYFELLARCAGLGTVWCGMLKFALDAAPELRPCLGLDPDVHFYAILFGYPDVRYARTVQRDAAAAIRRLSFG